MKNEPRKDLIETLDDLLDRERKSLLDGNIEQIENIMSEKERLFGDLNAKQPAPSGDLEKIRNKVKRNQALLNSALEGIRAVADRMAELRRVRAGLQTYDRRGNKQSFGTRTSPNMEKRA